MGGTHADGACFDTGEQIYGASTSRQFGYPFWQGLWIVEDLVLRGSGHMVPLDRIWVMTADVCCDRQEGGNVWWRDIEGTSGGWRI
jgi:hypothetical protein